MLALFQTRVEGKPEGSETQLVQQHNLSAEQLIKLHRSPFLLFVFSGAVSSASVSLDTLFSPFFLGGFNEKL